MEIPSIHGTYAQLKCQVQVIQNYEKIEIPPTQILQGWLGIPQANEGKDFYIHKDAKIAIGQAICGMERRFLVRQQLEQHPWLYDC